MQTALAFRVAVRVVPRSPRTVVGGLRDGRLLVRVTAAPVDGAANDAVIAAVAEAFGVARRAVAVIGGQTSRNKTVAIAGLRPEAARARLDSLSAD